MSLEFQIAEILATILTATVEPEDLQPLYDDLAVLCEFMDALNETVPGHDDECLCAASALAEHDAEEAAETLLSLRLEPGRPAPLRLRRCNALCFTETGANACEGGAARPETPTYTPEESPSLDGNPCPCSENRGADCDCWEEQFREPGDSPYLTEGGDVYVTSAERS